MSSMTDLVFLLLIFFIILSTMVSPYAVKVDLPNGSTQSKNKQKVSLSVDADLNYKIGNRVIAKENLEQELSNALSSFEKKSILLHLDKSVPTGNTVEILDVAKRNQWLIAIATKP